MRGGQGGVGPAQYGLVSIWLALLGGHPHQGFRLPHSCRHYCKRRLGLMKERPQFKNKTKEKSCLLIRGLIVRSVHSATEQRVSILSCLLCCYFLYRMMYNTIITCTIQWGSFIIWFAAEKLNNSFYHLLERYDLIFPQRDFYVCLSLNNSNILQNTKNYFLEYTMKCQHFPARFKCLP